MPPRTHDYRHLIDRWRTVARRAGIPLRRLVRADGFDLYALVTPALTKHREPGAPSQEPRSATSPLITPAQPITDYSAPPPPHGLYISAGIHGDEPASTEALITWAEAQPPRQLAKLPLLLLPCLNPWGLINNRRSDAGNIDLNRSFHLEESIPVIRAVKDLVTGVRESSVQNGQRPRLFAAALLMHEDYDGQGVYLYEAQAVRSKKGTPCHWGEALLKAATKSTGLLIDPRARIENRKVVKGIHRRRLDRRRFAKIGYPEAIWLHLEHSARTFTVETPSEFAIGQRVAAHIAMIDEVVRRATA